MSKLEHRLFFFLLQRWSRKKYFQLGLENGVICLMRNSDYDLRITRTRELRKKNTTPRESKLRGK